MLIYHTPKNVSRVFAEANFFL